MEFAGIWMPRCGPPVRSEPRGRGYSAPVANLQGPFGPSSGGSPGWARSCCLR